MARLARNLFLLVPAALLLGGGCAGDDADEPTRTLIAFTQIGDPEPNEIWTARADGTAPRRLVRGVGPAVSPDGRWIAFHRCDHVHCDLYVLSAAGGTPRLLARRAESPAWSLDSDRIVASRSMGDVGTALLSIDPRTGREVELARGGLYGRSVSPSGDDVVYGRGGRAKRENFAGERVDLHVIGIDGGEPRQLTHDGRSGFPVWGPDAIAFARLIPYRGWGRHEIWRIDPDGSDPKPVTGPLPKRLLGSGITGLVPFAWSADGRSLVAELTNEFGGPPYAVDPETGAIRKIGNFGYAAVPVGLSRDGRFVLVVEGGLPETSARLGLVIVPYAGGRPRVVRTGAGWASWNR